MEGIELCLSAVTIASPKDARIEPLDSMVVVVPNRWHRILSIDRLLLSSSVRGLGVPVKQVPLPHAILL